jgi:hypothetical protein
VPKAVLSVLILLSLAMWGAGVAGSCVSRPSVEPVAAADGEAAATEPVPDRRGEPLPQLVGFSLNVYHTHDIQRELAAIDELADLGFNAVQIVTPIFQNNGSDAAPRRIEGPGHGPPLHDLELLLQRADARGMTASLMFQINFLAPRGNEWRGQAVPPDWDAWWSAYERIALQYAAVAERANADIFVVGCELLRTQEPEHRVRWERLIERIRRDFGGRLTYSTTWDTFDVVPFWPALDLVGVSGWWNITRAADDADAPTDGELAARWDQILRQLRGLGERVDRPVLITELGYPSLPWALRNPWNYVASGDQHATPQVQARGYRSFLLASGGVLQRPVRHDPTPPATRSRIKPPAAERDNRFPVARGGVAGHDGWLAGVLFYEWAAWTPGGLDDTGYSVRGKPAYHVLRRWLDGESP